MKKLTVALSFLLAFLTLNAQDFSKLEEIELTESGDYKSNESRVLECSDYILSQPYQANEINKLTCMQFIIKWMEGTPDYMFNIGTDFIDLCGDDTELATAYMASLAKAATDTKFEDKSPEALINNARVIFLDYCSEPDNKVKKNKAIKKALKETTD